MLNRSHTENT